MSNNSVNTIDATIDYNEEPVESPRTTPVLDIPTAPHSPKECERSLQCRYVRWSNWTKIKTCTWILNFVAIDFELTWWRENSCTCLAWWFASFCSHNCSSRVNWFFYSRVRIAGLSNNETEIEIIVPLLTQVEVDSLKSVVQFLELNEEDPDLQLRMHHKITQWEVKLTSEHRQTSIATFYRPNTDVWKISKFIYICRLIFDLTHQYLIFSNAHHDGLKKLHLYRVDMVDTTEKTKKVRFFSGEQRRT